MRSTLLNFSSYREHFLFSIIGVWLTDAVPSEMEQQMIGMTPLGRWGEPKDIAGPVAFLASEDAAWVTGQVLGASGGLLL